MDGRGPGWICWAPPSSYQLGNLCSGHQKGNLTGEFGFFAHRLYTEMYSTITYRYVTQYYLQYSILLINTGTRERVGTSTVSDAFGPNEVGTTYVFTLAPCRIWTQDHIRTTFNAQDFFQRREGGKDLRSCSYYIRPLNSVVDPNTGSENVNTVLLST